jgi:L-lactate utilization protein LutB
MFNRTLYIRLVEPNVVEILTKIASANDVQPNHILAPAVRMSAEQFQTVFGISVPPDVYTMVPLQVKQMLKPLSLTIDLEVEAVQY